MSVCSHIRHPTPTDVHKQIKGTGATGWRTPFLLLLLFIAGCMALLYRWYEKLRKSHIL